MQESANDPEVLIDSGGIHRVIRGRHGDFIYNKHDIYIGRSLERYGEFSESEVNLFQQVCRPGDVVVEVGANIGSHTVPLAKAVGNEGYVVAFEPQPVIFQLLCGNVALNSLTNVQCLQLAVGETSGQIKVPNLSFEQENNFGGLSLETASSGQPVPLVTLDKVLTTPKLRLLKIDVEGMEQRVLQGASNVIQRLRPAIYVENDRIERSKSLIEFIASMGYDLFWHLPPLYNPDNFAGQTENIFPNIVSANMFCVPQGASQGITGLTKIESSSEHPMHQSNPE